MSNSGFGLILKHTVKIARRSGFVETPMGQRRSTGETVVHSLLSVFFDFNPGKYSNNPAGDFQEYQYIMFAPASANVQPGDYLYPQSFITGLTLGRVLATTPIADFAGMTHHIESLVQKIG